MSTETWLMALTWVRGKMSAWQRPWSWVKETNGSHSEGKEKIMLIWDSLMLSWFSFPLLILILYIMYFLKFVLFWFSKVWHLLHLRHFRYISPFFLAVIPQRDHFCSRSRLKGYIVPTMQSKRLWDVSKPDMVTLKCWTWNSDQIRFLCNWWE